MAKIEFAIDYNQKHIRLNYILLLLLSLRIIELNLRQFNKQLEILSNIYKP